MRANIPDELLNAINEKIYLDLELHVLNRKLLSAESEGYAKYLEQIIKNVTTQRKEVNEYLKQNGVKVYDVVEIDDMFIEYPYVQSIKGGYKEGTQRFWRIALRNRIQERLEKYFTRR